MLFAFFFCFLPVHTRFECELGVFRTDVGWKPFVESWRETFLKVKAGKFENLFLQPFEPRTEVWFKVL